MKKIVRVLWKTYAVLYMILIVGGLIGDFIDTNLMLIDHIDAILTVPTLLAVIGWAWKKCVGTALFWIIYSVTFFSFDITYNVFFDNHPKTGPLDVALGILVVLPAYIGTVLFALNFETIRRRNVSIGPRANKTPYIPATRSAAIDQSPAEPTPGPWSMPRNGLAEDPQLIEIRQMQQEASARQALATSIAKETKATYDYTYELENIGKWPGTRWFSHPFVGRDAEKGIADIIFLSIFESSAADDTKYTKKQRTVIRVVLTLAVIAIISEIKHLLMQP